MASNFYPCGTITAPGVSICVWLDLFHSPQNVCSKWTSSILYLSVFSSLCRTIEWWSVSPFSVNMKWKPVVRAYVRYWEASFNALTHEPGIICFYKHARLHGREWWKWFSVFHNLNIETQAIPFFFYNTTESFIGATFSFSSRIKEQISIKTFMSKLF